MNFVFKKTLYTKRLTQEYAVIKKEADITAFCLKKRPVSDPSGDTYFLILINK
jgi:hypothetical protein